MSHRAGTRRKAGCQVHSPRPTQKPRGPSLRRLGGWGRTVGGKVWPAWKLTWSASPRSSKPREARGAAPSDTGAHDSREEVPNENTLRTRGSACQKRRDDRTGTKDRHAQSLSRGLRHRLHGESGEGRRLNEKQNRDRRNGTHAASASGRRGPSPAARCSSHACALAWHGAQTPDDGRCRVPTPRATWSRASCRHRVVCASVTIGLSHVSLQRNPRARFREPSSTSCVR